MQKTAFLFYITFSLLLNACAQAPQEAQPCQNSLITINAITTLVPPRNEANSFQYAKEELLGKLDPSKHQDFQKIANTHTSKPNIYLRTEAYASFKKMFEAAAKDGVQMQIISATRNFDYQKGIWEKKWLRKKYAGWSEVDKVRDILKYSSMPGTSRHHWGTDVDFYSVQPSDFASGHGKKLYDWLIKNAAAYGFAQTYSSKSGGRSGYEEEKWHWSYMPISSVMLKEYNALITYADLTGFNGSASAEAAEVIKLYVNGIDSALKMAE